MTLSILLITYNQSAYILQCIESIRMQQVDGSIELIVADDCSTDDTLEKIREGLNDVNYPVIYLDTPKNLGFVKNYQRAFAACTGSYIAVMEGDDYWTAPNRLQTHIDFLSSHHECVLTANRYITFLQSDLKYQVNDWPHPEDSVYVTGQEMALDNRLGGMSACVFRRSAIRQLKHTIYELLIADWMIGMALCEFGLIAILKNPSSVYRIHSKGQYSGLGESERLALMNKHLDEYDQYLDHRYHDEFELHRQRLNNTQATRHSRTPLRDFFPPVLIKFIKLVTPPVIARRFTSITK